MYLLGVDFGGGASKATLLREDGVVTAVNTVEYRTIYPKQGYAEQNPSDWYSAIKENIMAVIKKSGIHPSEIAALSLDAATHTAVVCDKDFNVLCPSIYWTDTRSTDEVRYLKENFGDLILSSAYHSVDTIWTLPQLLWLKNKKPGVWEKCRRIMFAKDYVRHMLTGDYVTDNIEAQGSMLFDFNTGAWSEKLCEIIGFDACDMPQVVHPGDTAGTVTKKAAEETGLCEGTKVICGTTDTAMEVFASGAAALGETTVKLATAGRICVITDRAYPDKNLVNYSHIVDGLWYPGTATKSCAASYRWYRDTFGDDYKALDCGAQQIPPGCDGLFFHPYLNGELTPYADPLLRGSFTGIRAGHDKRHFSRAVLEGVAYSLSESKNVLENLGISHNSYASIIGGGAYSPLWRQIVSDVLGISLVLRKNSDSSLGSAMLAGISADIFENPADAINRCTEIIGETNPNTDNHLIYAENFKTYKKIHDALAPVYHEMKL